MKDLEGRLARWAAKLQNYDFDIVHRPGAKHGNADALSQLPLVAALAEELDATYELIGHPEKWEDLDANQRKLLEKLSLKISEKMEISIKR